MVARRDRGPRRPLNGAAASRRPDRPGNKMEKESARATLKRMLRPYREKIFEELKSLLDSEVRQEIVTQPDGVQYKCTLKVVWADWPDGHIIVFGLAEEHPRRPLFWRVPLLRWLPVYTGKVAEAFTPSPQNLITGEESH